MLASGGSSNSSGWEELLPSLSKLRPLGRGTALFGLNFLRLLGDSTVDALTFDLVGGGGSRKAVGAWKSELDGRMLKLMFCIR